MRTALRPCRSCYPKGSIALAWKPVKRQWLPMPVFEWIVRTWNAVACAVQGHVPVGSVGFGTCTHCTHCSRETEPCEVCSDR